MGKRLQTYENEVILVTFDPDICTHSAKCLNGLPDVFAVGRQPWIHVENADAADIAATVRQCPSGALQYRFKDPSCDGSHNGASRSGRRAPDPTIVSGGTGH